jgi:FSR family fosmidomycin resistance protein-like MFS transporter
MSGTAGGTAAKRRWLPLLLVSLGHGATHWSLAMVYLLMPFIQRDLELSYAEVGLLISVMHAASVVVNIPAGALVDLTGRRIAWQVMTLLALSLALLGLGAVPHYGVLMAAIAAIGAFAVMWHPPAISYLSRIYEARRGMAMSLHTLGASFGDAAAPLAAGLTIAALGWQQTALWTAAAPLGVAALILLLRGSDPIPPARHADGGGSGGFLAGLRTLFSDSATLMVCFTAGLRSTAQSGMLAFLPLYLTNQLGVGPQWLGISLMVLQGFGAVSTGTAGGLSDRIGRKPVMLIATGGLSACAFLMTTTDGLPLFVAWIGAVGFFMYGARPVLHSWSLDVAPPALGGSVIGMLFAAQSLFSIIVPVVGGLVADRYGLIPVFWMLGGAAALAFCVASRVPDRRAAA